MLTERLVNDKDAVDMISEFWDKLAHIEYNYARRYANYVLCLNFSFTVLYLTA